MIVYAPVLSRTGVFILGDNMKVLKSLKKPKALKIILETTLFTLLVFFQVGLAFAEVNPVRKGEVLKSSILSMGTDNYDSDLGRVTEISNGVKIAILDSGSRTKVEEAVSFTSLAPDFDPLEHGTKITQIIKKENPDAQILFVQICEKKQFGYGPDIEAVIKGIEWAKAKGADIINMSLTLSYDEQLAQLIEKTSKERGIIFVAAAGNKSFVERFAFDSEYATLKSETEFRKLEFPASLNAVISVGAIDKYGRIADYSANNATTYADGKYGKMNGTSFATAKVSGKISKILAENPNLNLDGVKATLP